MKCSQRFLISTVTLFAMSATNVWALSAPALQDLGTLGPTYEITEPHLLDVIRARLRAKEASGELAQLMRAAQGRSIASVENPTPVPGLRSTQSARTFYVDPSFVLDRNISDAQGRLMFAAGTRKNPLEVVSLSKHLLFFDGRDAQQVARALALMKQSTKPLKPILTAGSYLNLMKSWRVPVYYDQQGVLTRRFGIQHVPALVSQEGLRLRVDELVLR
jgi:conjugal transfer pilus assembly protein TraW